MKKAFLVLCPILLLTETVFPQTIKPKYNRDEVIKLFNKLKEPAEINAVEEKKSGAVNTSGDTSKKSVSTSRVKIIGDPRRSEQCRFDFMPESPVGPIYYILPFKNMQFRTKEC